MHGRYLAAALVAVLPLLLAAPLGLPAEKDDPGFLEATDGLQDAVDRGLRYLARAQSPVDGSIGKGYEVAITSLAGLSFLAGGNTPSRGKYAENVRRALRYLLDRSRQHFQGFIQEPNGQSRMHGHGYATLFFAEALGMSEGVPGFGLKDHNGLRDQLKKAVQVIIKAQTQEGGWGYSNQGDFDEASVTVCEVQALRSARNAGIVVPKEVIDHAIDYIQRCQKPADGSFKYSLKGHAERSSFALTAAAVSALIYTGYGGQYDTPEVRQGIEFMLRNRPGGVRNESGHYFYENYYAALAMYYAGGDYWRNWFPYIREQLVNRQSRRGNDGCWSGEYGDEYCTAFATLILQIPYRYLPIFQR